MQTADIIPLDENVRRLFFMMNLPPVPETATHLAFFENGDRFYMSDFVGDLGTPEMITVPIYRNYQVGF